MLTGTKSWHEHPADHACEQCELLLFFTSQTWFVKAAASSSAAHVYSGPFWACSHLLGAQSKTPTKISQRLRRLQCCWGSNIVNHRVIIILKKESNKANGFKMVETNSWRKRPYFMQRSQPSDTADPLDSWWFTPIEYTPRHGMTRVIRFSLSSVFTHFPHSKELWWTFWCKQKSQVMNYVKMNCFSPLLKTS